MKVKHLKTKTVIELTSEEIHDWARYEWVRNRSW